MAYSTMLIAPSVTLPWVPEMAVLTAIGADDPSAFDGCTVTPGGSTPRTPGITVEAPVTRVGRGVKVGRGVFVGVGTTPAERPTSVSPTEQARLAKRQQENRSQEQASSSRLDAILT